MTSKDKNWIVVGKFGRPQGLNGMVRLFSFTEPKSNLFDYKPWQAKINNEIKEIVPVEIQKNSKFDLVKICGYSSREEAASLTNIEIMVAEQQLPKLSCNDYYWHELIGMDVNNSQGVNLGKVVEMLETGANDVIIVEGEKRFLIPYLLDDYIASIDREKKLILVNWDPDF